MNRNRSVSALGGQLAEGSFQIAQMKRARVTADENVEQ